MLLTLVDQDCHANKSMPKTSQHLLKTISCLYYKLLWFSEWFVYNYIASIFLCAAGRHMT